ncbi:MAG: M15 family metallopeptidase [Oligoflexia bacterium]|nr:M15 family metallopeptidase [Oligoflexia bacterium]
MPFPVLAALFALRATVVSAVSSAVSSGVSTPPTPVVLPLSDALRAAMTGTSWREGCPVPLDDLRLVMVPFVDPAGASHAGRLILHADSADAVAGVLLDLYQQRFPITSLRPAYEFGGDDDAMMRANNSSAFNCRPVAGSSTWSQHSYGRAVDLNPLWNPYVRGARIDPPQGRLFVDRDPDRPGTIVADGVVVTAFQAIGWRWGGRWSRAKDYQHFSATGR